MLNGKDMTSFFVISEKKIRIFLLFCFQARAYPATDVAPYRQMPAKLKIVRVLKPWRCAHLTKHVSSSKDCTKRDQVNIIRIHSIP